VELPQIPADGLTRITNHSQIWVFLDYDRQNIKAEVNKNNIISSTHWIINMDKKLPMHEIVPVLETIKNKRGNKSIHYVEGMKTYLSYSNTKSKNISLYEIDSTQYLVMDKLNYTELMSHYKTDTNIYINETSFLLNNKIYPSKLFDKSLLESLPNIPIHFFMDGNISYQNYLEKRVLLKKYAPQETVIDKTEYVIYN
jgi:hypothetical protein